MLNWPEELTNNTKLMDLMDRPLTGREHSIKFYAHRTNMYSEVFLYCTKCGAHLDPENEPVENCHAPTNKTHVFKVFLNGSGAFGKPVIGCECGDSKNDDMHLPNGNLFTLKKPEEALTSQ